MDLLTAARICNRVVGELAAGEDEEARLVIRVEKSNKEVSCFLKAPESSDPDDDFELLRGQGTDRVPDGVREEMWIDLLAELLECFFAWRFTVIREKVVSAEVYAIHLHLKHWRRPSK